MDIYLDSRMRKDELSQQLITMAQHELLTGEKLADENLLVSYDPEMEAIHRRHAGQLRQIIAEIGWPTRSKVGLEASEAAWLIVQHSISEAAFMKECYQMMESVAADINPRNLAYLFDRICYFSEQPQRYGTQYQGVRLYPVEDPVAVNALRAELGLPPIPDEKITTDRVQDFQTDTVFNQWRKKAGWI